MSRTDLLD